MPFKRSPVVMTSPLPPDAAARALHHAITPGALTTYGFIRGEVSGRRIVLSHQRPGEGNSPKPWLIARLEPDGDGSRLQGRFRLSWYIRCMLLAGCLLLLGAIGITVHGLLQGEGIGSVVNALAVAAIWAFMAVKAPALHRQDKALLLALLQRVLAGTLHSNATSPGQR